jgi:hypothetical protein
MGRVFMAVGALARASGQWHRTFVDPDFAFTKTQWQGEIFAVQQRLHGLVRGG